MFTLQRKNEKINEIDALQTKDGKLFCSKCGKELNEALILRYDLDTKEVFCENCENCNPIEKTETKTEKGLPAFLSKLSEASIPTTISRGELCIQHTFRNKLKKEFLTAFEAFLQEYLSTDKIDTVIHDEGIVLEIENENLETETSRISIVIDAKIKPLTFDALDEA